MKKERKLEIYLVLIFIVTLFMCVGYAKISDMSINIYATVDTNVQDGVFITDITKVSSIDANLDDSKINNYYGTMFESNVVLNKSSNSQIIYEISLYNNSDINYLFIDVLTDYTNENLYSNTNITFRLDGLEKEVTTILPYDSLSFKIIFEYVEDADYEKNTLLSILNFRFEPKPVLVMSNDGNIYDIENIYPGYVFDEYEFEVLNYDGNEINNVELSYYFNIVGDELFEVDIYKYIEDGTEVKLEQDEEITLNGDGQTKLSHKYIAKISFNDSQVFDWDDFSNQNYEINIKLESTLESANKDKYGNYTINREFRFNISTAPLYFESIIENNLIEYRDGRAEIDVNIKNNDGTNYNLFETEYKISLINNSKFELYVDDEKCTNNVTQKTINGENIINVLSKIQFVKKADVDIEKEEICNLVIEAIYPYYKKIEFNFTVTKDLGLNAVIDQNVIPVKYQNGNWVEADATVFGDWFDYAEKKWANILTDNGYFVWIPRYAYKITSKYHEASSSAGTVAIVFLNKDNTIKNLTDSEGNIVNQEDIVTPDEVNSSIDGEGINATTKYIIHPAFIAMDTEEENVDGLWVAKYEMSMEQTLDGGLTWSHKAVESTTVGNISIAGDTTKKMVSKSGVSSWRYIDVTNIFENCYNMNRNFDSHMMKNSEWGLVTYLGMSKYGNGAKKYVEQNKSTSYLTGCGSNGNLSTGAASTTGNMYGVFDMSGGSYEYVAGYLEDVCLNSTSGSLYNINSSLVNAENKYKDVYNVDETGTTSNAFTVNCLKVGDGLWEISDGSSIWFNNEFFYAGISDGGHYPIFDRGGDYGTWSSSIGINYTGRNNGENHPGVSFRVVIKFL